MHKQLALTALVAAVLAPVAGACTQVTVPSGQPVQIAFTIDTTQGSPFAGFSGSAENAIRMAIAEHPAIRGFPIRLNTVESLCLGGDNTTSAQSIVSNAQNVAVLGNLCSFGSETALPVYETAGVVTISGSASNSGLPLLAPSVFNRTIVVSDAVGDTGDVWAAQVAGLPSVVAWDVEYESEFGSAPVLSPLPALYFDAASLLIRRLQQVSRVAKGSLVIDRAALARAVRNTVGFQGATCTVSLDPQTGNRVDDPAALSRCAQS